MTVQIRLYDSDLTKRKLYILCCRITRHQNGGGEGLEGGAYSENQKANARAKVVIVPCIL